MAYEWLKINPTTGTGTGTVTTTIESHSGYATREKTVKVSATINNTSTSTSVKFNQAGTITTGTGAMRIAGSSYTAQTTTISAAVLRSSGTSGLEFDINGTNAKNFQYFIELIAGTISPKDVSNILLPPNYVTTSITDVTVGTAVPLSAFTTGNIIKPGELLFTYSMGQADLDRNYGKNQTYSIKLKAVPNTTSFYTNTASTTLEIKYGIKVLVPTDASGTSTTPVELKSVYVSFPPSTAFSASVPGGTDIGASGSTKSIEVTAPSDVTWNAKVV